MITQPLIRKTEKRFFLFKLEIHDILTYLVSGDPEMVSHITLT